MDIKHSDYQLLLAPYSAGTIRGKVERLGMTKVFINYRTCDEPNVAVLLKRELSSHLGSDNVFLSSGMISPGDDFECELLRRVRDTTILLTVVGSRWLDAPNGNGGRALDNDRDWVRREIAEALVNGVRVVPVLVDDTTRLTNARLPADIAQIAKNQFLRYRSKHFEADLATIVSKFIELLNGAMDLGR